MYEEKMRVLLEAVDQLQIQVGNLQSVLVVRCRYLMKITVMFVLLYTKVITTVLLVFKNLIGNLNRIG